MCLFLVGRAAAQACDLYFPQAVGTKLTYQNLDAKGKFQGTHSYQVVEKTGNARKVHFEFVDEKNKEVSKIDYDMVCEDGTIKIDMRSFVGQMAKSFPEGFEIKGDINYIVIPAELSVGLVLPDAKVVLEIWNEGKKFSTVEVNITNRRVTGKQSVTSVPGTFDCWVMESDSEVISRIALGAGNGPGIPFRAKSKEFVSAGTGLIRSETYSKNDKLVGTVLLDSIE